VVFRIHFTAEDLARTRIAKAPTPMIELVGAARALRARDRPAQLDGWRRHALQHLSPQARLALSLIPPLGVTPDFLSPQRSGTPEEELEHVRATPLRQISEDLALVAETQALPAWAHRLSDNASLRDDLFDGLTHLYTHLLGSYWTSIEDLQASDRAVRLRQFLIGGVEHVLARASPRWITWNPPVLEIRTVIKDASYDLHLEGRGLLLVPSFFQTRSAAVLDDGHSTPVLTYFCSQAPSLAHLTVMSPEPAASSAADAVTALLGRTRAAVLYAIAENPGCTTTELARAVRIAPSSASEHATVLREAGLVRTTRHRNTVLHNPSSLGAALLNVP
jgi:hypothetical protein